MIIYSKYNSSRRKDFQLVTKIEKEDGIIFSSKIAENEKAKPFLKSLFRKYQFLKDNGFSLHLVEPKKIDDEKIIFEYKNGKLLSSLLFKLVQDSDRDNFIQLLRTYFELIKKNKIKNEKLNPEFIKIFGNNSDLEFDCVQIGCLDFNFDNIILEKSEKEFYIIDYEWTFEFPIPYKYIIFRALVSFYKNYFFYNFNKNFIPLVELYDIFEITKKERDIFINFEYNFQIYVENVQNKELEKYIKSYEKIESGFVIPDYLADIQLSIQKKDHEIKVIKSSKFWKMREHYLKILGQFRILKNFGKRFSPHRIKIGWYKIFSIISGKPIKYDFVDYGSKSEGSMALAMKKFGGRRGLGIEIRPDFVEEAKSKGHNVMLGDVTKLSLPDKFVRFTMICHFLEHLSGIESVKSALKNAVRISREFVYIRGPIFDNDEYLKKLGLKVYWSDWSGHACHLTTKQLSEILDSLGVKSYEIKFEVEMEDSNNKNIHPIDSPPNQHYYDSKQHPPKKFSRFNKKLYREFICIVKV